VKWFLESSIRPDESGWTVDNSPIGSLSVHPRHSEGIRVDRVDRMRFIHPVHPVETCF